MNHYFRGDLEFPTIFLCLYCTGLAYAKMIAMIKHGFKCMFVFYLNKHRFLAGQNVYRILAIHNVKFLS